MILLYCGGCHLILLKKNWSMFYLNAISKEAKKKKNSKKHSVIFLVNGENNGPHL